MAGKGGGAWKVAYADFVTAMMAFFLVMWIVAQDQKIKEAIAHYFVDPMGYFPMGQRTTTNSGGIFESKSTGSVPHSQAVAMGKGRTTHTDEHGDGAVTKMVSDWLHGDRELHAHWKQHADRIRMAVTDAAPNGSRSEAEAAAAARLAQLLSSEFHQNMPTRQPGVYRDLMLEALAEVNWQEIAEDLISE